MSFDIINKQQLYIIAITIIVVIIEFCSGEQGGYILPRLPPPTRWYSCARIGGQ